MFKNNSIKVFTVVLTCTIFAVFARGIEDSSTLELLTKYGYIAEQKPGTGLLLSPEAITSAIKRFQSYAGLKPSGLMDKATTDKLKEPRCGMSDKKVLGRSKRYVHQGTRWTKNDLTWKIIRYSSNPRRTMGQMDIRRTVHDTLAKWSAVTKLNFKEVGTDDADIKVSFVRGSHEDPYPFDGMGGTLAHAYYPANNKGLSGDAHFDDDEDFTLRSKSGTNFFWVALHEFGHSIGMEHSADRDAIMYPWYQGYKGDDVGLRPDDISGIQALYGTRKNTAPTTKATTKAPVAPVTTKSYPPACFDRIQATFLGADKRTYVINDDKLYVLGEFLKVLRGPVPVGSVFKGLTKVDAAMKIETGELVFFHGDKYWMFRGYQRISGPNNIRQFGLTDDMKDLDAAVNWKGSGKQYFFKGDKFWRRDASNGRLDPEYPKSISLWGDKLSSVDAALHWTNNALYFFKGNSFHRFDTRKISLVPGYPRKLKDNFIICPNQGSAGEMSGDFNSVRQTGNSAATLELKVIKVALLAGFVTIAIIKDILF